MLQSILRDVPRKAQAFAYVQKVLLEGQYDDAAKASVEKAFMRQLDALVAADVKKTALVVFYNMPAYTPLVIAKLEDNREVYDLLSLLLDPFSNDNPFDQSNRLNRLWGYHVYNRRVGVSAGRIAIASFPPLFPLFLPPPP